MTIVYSHAAGGCQGQLILDKHYQVLNNLITLTAAPLYCPTTDPQSSLVQEVIQGGPSEVLSTEGPSV